jgi:cellulose synthase/poly-beta-1,6-N-acetylglucosamine synthase-like glycosyltransferase
MSLHNEKEVAEKKIRSMLASDYPAEKLDFIIGSDGSDDGTGAVITALAANNPHIKLIINAERKGKAAMLNELAPKAKGDILVVTDANVMFTPSVVRKMAEGFEDPRTGLCDATVRPFSADDMGITRQEIMYSRFETALKRAEGNLWGAMPGPYGGCYAVRRNLFPRLPDNTLVDDLFVGLSVLNQNYRAFNIPDAAVYEDTQPDMIEQFRRRTRIAAGSFQNLFRFGPCISGRPGVVFAFLSHKIMRWLTPLLLVLFFMTTVILSGRSDFYFCLTAVQLIFIILSAIDIAIDRRGKKLLLQRYVTQFLLMNAALAAGFVKAVRGIENGIWEPTKRV